MRDLCRLMIFCCLFGLFSCKKSTSVFQPGAKRFQGTYLLGIPGQDTPKRDKQPKGSERAIEYFDRTNLRGDFDGDGTSEMLYESMRSYITGRQIDSVIYENFPEGFYDPYSGLVDAISVLEPCLKLKSPDGLPDLKLNHTPQVFGILDIKNLGNINRLPGDEFALIVDWADWSKVNTCSIYTLHKSDWVCQFTFEIRDSFSIQDSCLSPIDQVLIQKHGYWYYDETNATKSYTGWKKLNLDSFPAYD